MMRVNFLIILFHYVVIPNLFSSCGVDGDVNNVVADHDDDR